LEESTTQRRAGFYLMRKRQKGDIGTSPGKQGKAVDFFVWRTLSIHTYAFFAALRNGFNTLEEDLSFLTAFTATMYFLSQVWAESSSKNSCFLNHQDEIFCGSMYRVLDDLKRTIFQFCV
jgi:hypothetical protein